MIESDPEIPDPSCVFIVFQRSNVPCDVQMILSCLWNVVWRVDDVEGPPIRSAPLGVWRRLQVKINIHTCSSRTCRGYVRRTRFGRLSDLPTKGAPTRTTVIHVKVFERSSGSSNGQQQQQPLERTRSGSVLAVSGGADAACCSGWATSVALGRSHSIPTHPPTHPPTCRTSPRRRRSGFARGRRQQGASGRAGRG